MEKESNLLIDMTETATSKIKEVIKEQELNNSYLRIQLTANEHGAPGYAFGLGIERITMLLYQIDDLISPNTSNGKRYPTVCY